MTNKKKPTSGRLKKKPKKPKNQTREITQALKQKKRKKDKFYVFIKNKFTCGTFILYVGAIHEIKL